MDLPSEEERFSTNASIMVNAIYETVLKLHQIGHKSADPNLVKFAGIIMAGFDKHYLIQGFITNSHSQCWDSIKTRNEEYFLANSHNIFKNLPSGRVDLFKDLFTAKDNHGNSLVSQETKDSIWSLFDAMVKISIKYIHKNRSPTRREINGKVINIYAASFFDDIDISGHASKWGLKLEFIGGKQ